MAKWKKQLTNIIKNYESVEILNMEFIIKDNKNNKIISSAKTIDELSDGYHTFKELYDFRREYNAAFVNSEMWKAHKSYRHHDGELCFGGGWFIVMIDTPFGQISNHYENEYWSEFHCEKKEVADEWDGHTEKDVLNRLHYSNKKWEDEPVEVFLNMED